MKTIFDVCVPHDEVLRGELREQQFAGSLTKVLRWNADAVYGGPATFFANTYATGGLKSLLREGLGRLTGSNPGAAAVVRIETKFFSPMVGHAIRMRGVDGWPLVQTRT